MSRTAGKPDAKTKLLDAALRVIRTKGYNATTVDELCAAAGVTKGAFFHHFKTKDDLAVAAAEHWSQITGALFASAPYHDHADPLDRILAYVDFRKALLQGETPASLALHTQAVLQGAFILAKAKGGPDVAAQSIDHLRRYLALLLRGPEKIDKS